MNAPMMAAPGRLAGALQEFITAVVRLRAERQPVSDAVAFRAQITGLLARAEQDAIGMGFTPADARLAMFAVVAYLDESVLNVRNPALADWARRPLQDELFGAHMGGEWFFQHVEQLLARPDSPELADLLEVHQLCLLLGFHGKYGATESSQLHTITSRVAERIGRLRGLGGDLAPSWRPPADRVDANDPLLRTLTIVALSCFVLLFSLWGTYAFTLRNTRTGIRAMAPNVLAATSAR